MYLASLLLQSLVLGTQIAMVALALYLVWAASRISHLAIGAIGAASAYGLYWGINLEWPLWVSILCALGIAVLLGLLCARILEPFALRQEPLLGLLVSFGLGLIIESLIAILFGTDGKSLQQGVLSVVYAGNVFLDIPGVITICFGGGLALLAWILLHFTTSGRPCEASPKIQLSPRRWASILPHYADMSIVSPRSLRALSSSLPDGMRRSLLSWAFSSSLPLSWRLS